MDDVWIENIFSFYFYPIDGWLAMYQPSIVWYLSSVLSTYLPTYIVITYILYLLIYNIYEC
jgi:hypothetical protein